MRKYVLYTAGSSVRARYTACWSGAAYTAAHNDQCGILHPAAPFTISYAYGGAVVCDVVFSRTTYLRLLSYCSFLLDCVCLQLYAVIKNQGP